MSNVTRITPIDPVNIADAASDEEKCWVCDGEGVCHDVVSREFYVCAECNGVGTVNARPTARFDCIEFYARVSEDANDATAE